MEFPITRIRLQNICNEKFISDIIEVLTERIIQTAYNNTTKLQILLRELHRRQTVLRHVSIEDNIPKIISKLQERFPDTTITLDTQKTYIYVDWS